MKNGKMKRPAIRGRAAAVSRRTLTLGELISAAYDVLGDTRHVVRVLGSAPLSKRMGRKLVLT